MRRFVCVVAVLLLVCCNVRADFQSEGFDLQVVQSGTGIRNAAVSFQTNPVWVGTTPAKPYTLNTSFTLPASDEILFSRLYANIWGGTNSYTCGVDATVNGVALSTINIGGTTDTNPTYDASVPCAYGSGYGAWQTAWSDVGAQLRTDGTANPVSITISDPSGNFDGRMFDVTLVTVYRDASLNNRLDYYLAEADGYLRRSPGTPGAPNERTVAFNGVDTDDLVSASYTTLYTHGNSGQLDRFFWNGTQLGGDDVAVGALGLYGPDVVTWDVASLLQGDNTAGYHIPDPDGETSLMAKVGLLQVHHTPEPGTLLLASLSVLIGGWLRRCGSGR